MTIHLPKVNQFGGGNGGGGGSSSLPIIVTDSGSSLPVDLTGYNEGDTFLNTTDKKIYKAEETITGYTANTDTTLTVTVDYTTGIATGFAYTLFCERTGLTDQWYGTREVKHSVKFKVSSVQTTPVILFSSQSGNNNNYALFYIDNNGKIFHRRYDYNYGFTIKLDNQILDTDIVADKIYILNITKTGTNCVAQLTEENGTVLEEKNFTTEDLDLSLNKVSFGFGYIDSSNVWASNLSVYLGDSTGNLVIPTNALSWDNGTSLTDKTEYADKTNGTLYLYENSELVKIGGSLTKKVYTISADNTSTLDVSSDFTKVVDVLKNGVELAITDDYTISSGVITFVTALSTTDKITVKGE